MKADHLISFIIILAKDPRPTAAHRCLRRRSHASRDFFFSSNAHTRRLPRRPMRTCHRYRNGGPPDIHVSIHVFLLVLLYWLATDPRPSAAHRRLWRRSHALHDLLFKQRAARAIFPRLRRESRFVWLSGAPLPPLPNAQVAATAAPHSYTPW